MIQVRPTYTVPQKTPVPDQEHLAPGLYEVQFANISMYGPPHQGQDDWARKRVVVCPGDLILLLDYRCETETYSASYNAYFKGEHVCFPAYEEHYLSLVEESDA